jgi:hypothetical protein
MIDLKEFFFFLLSFGILISRNVLTTMTLLANPLDVLGSVPEDDLVFLEYEAFFAARGFGEHLSAQRGAESRPLLASPPLKHFAAPETESHSRAV